MKLTHDIITPQLYLYADTTEFTIIRREVPPDTCEDHVLIELKDGTRVWLWAEDIDEQGKSYIESLSDKT